MAAINANSKDKKFFVSLNSQTTTAMPIKEANQYGNAFLKYLIKFLISNLPYSELI